MDNIYKVSFFVSGQGRLFKQAVRNASLLGIKPELLFLDEKASSDLENFAISHNISYSRSNFTDKERFYKTMHEACLRSTASLLVLTFDKIVPESVLNLFPDGVINLHLSLLPAFKGFSAMQAAINNGNKFIGATIHLANSNADDGPIIAQALTAVAPGDDVDSIQSKLSLSITKMYLQTILWFKEGRVKKVADRIVKISDAKYDFSSVVPNIEQSVDSIEIP